MKKRSATEEAALFPGLIDIPALKPTDQFRKRAERTLAHIPVCLYCSLGPYYEKKICD